MEKMIIAVDVETTGLNPRKDSLIEIGAVKLKEGKLIKWNRLINPGFPIPQKIAELTGITDDIASEGVSCEAALMEFLEFAEDAVLLGHNVLFDYSFLKTGYQKMKIPYEREGIDTLAIAKNAHKELPSRSLESLCTYYKIVNEQAHRACSDAAAAFLLYLKMKEIFQNEEWFEPKPLIYKARKEEPATAKQKKYLNDLMKYHKIKIEKSDEEWTKSEISRYIDHIILEHGKIY